MEKIKLITDTCCDIPKEEAARLGIQMLPIPITIGDKGYMEGEDFTNMEFYQLLLDSKALPCTSHIPAPVFQDAFEQAVEEGYNRIICVTINSKGSSMFQAANMARSAFFEDHPEQQEKVKIEIIDSHLYSMGYGMPLTIAAEMKEKGSSFEEITTFLKDGFSSMEVYFTMLTLDFAKKSGRIGAAAALVGGLLGLRPVLSFIDGDNKVASKTRGDKAVISELAKITVNRIADKSGPYCIATGMNTEHAAPLIEALTQELGHPPMGVYHIGASVAINAGPQVVGVGFFGEKRN